MINFDNTPPEWNVEGTEPTAEEKAKGWEVEDKVPAPYLNWFWTKVSKCLKELQSKLSNENTERTTAITTNTEALNTHKNDKSNPHGVTAEQIGLGNVDNTPDEEKHVAHAENATHATDANNAETAISDENGNRIIETYAQKKDLPTKESLEIDNVDNTKDSEKNVAFASEAGIGRKIKNALIMRFKGGSTEGTDLFTFDGSVSKSVNITADKIGAAENDLSNVDDDIFKAKVESNVTTGTPIVEAISTDGETYTATVDTITELYNGLEITIIPNMTSTKAAVQFNLNGLGAKNLRAKINGYNNGNSGTIAALAGWLGAETPITIRYLSKFDNWQTVDFSRPSASGLYGTIKPTQGGTGIDEETGITVGNFLVGNGTEKMLEKTPAEVKDLIGLGKVPNVATNDQTPTYSDTNTLSTLSSGEKLNVAFQKIKCAITNLINHLSNKNNPHGVTAEQTGALALSGGVMTGQGFYINNKTGRIVGNQNGLWLRTASSDVDNNEDARHLKIWNATYVTGLKRAFCLFDTKTNKDYLIYGEHNKPIVSGVYTGNASGTDGSFVTQKIDLGFTPKGVIVACGGEFTDWGNSGLFSGFVVQGSPLKNNANGNVGLEIVDGGFNATSQCMSSINGILHYNDKTKTYQYLAWE